MPPWFGFCWFFSLPLASCFEVAKSHVKKSHSVLVIGETDRVRRFAVCSPPIIGIEVATSRTGQDCNKR